MPGITLFTVSRERVMAHAVSRKTLSSRPGFEYGPVHPCGICNGQNGTQTVFLEGIIRVSTADILPQMLYYRRYILSI